MADRKQTPQTIGQIPVAPKPEDRDPAAAPPDPPPAHAAYRHGQRWRKVRMRAYRNLGNAIASIEALDRGEEELRGDGAAPPALEHLTVAEQLACRRGACLLLERVTAANIERALAYRPADGEDLVLVEVRVRQKS